MATERIQYAYDLTGVLQPVRRRFPIATNTAIEMGEVVKLSAGKVVAVGDTDQDDPYLGVAAEAHDGASEGETGTTIMVYCSPTAVFKCKPGILSTADSGNTTTWVDAELATAASAGFADDGWNGGYLKLKSTTALTVGIDKPIEITDFAVATGTFTGTFTGGVTAGDTALLLPPVGSKGWDLNTDGTNLNTKANGGESIMIVDVDTDQEWVYFILRLHQFGNGPAAL
jgi:hypothetical protein